MKVLAIVGSGRNGNTLQLTEDVVKRLQKRWKYYKDSKEYIKTKRGTLLSIPSLYLRCSKNIGKNPLRNTAHWIFNIGRIKDGLRIIVSII